MNDKMKTKLKTRYNRRDFLMTVGMVTGTAVLPDAVPAAFAASYSGNITKKAQEINSGVEHPSTQSKLLENVVGLYIHQHWPYNHPYAARTWTLDDWRGFAGGLKQLGYNTIKIWPMLETIPEPLTPSDRASLKKHAQVIDMLHNELGMSVIIVLCPNIVANNDARKATYETRHFYYSERFINPADKDGMAKMIVWREKIFRYLCQADAVAIIDCDPGGYPGSTNADFVNLLSEHRKMLDRPQTRHRT